MRGWIGSELVVFLTDPDDVEVILNSRVHIDKASEYRFFEPWLGNGLLISSGDLLKIISNKKKTSLLSIRALSLHNVLFFEYFLVLLIILLLFSALSAICTILLDNLLKERQVRFKQDLSIIRSSVF